MAQVLVAACVGIMAGWVGFGWVLAEAPGEHMVNQSQMASRAGVPAIGHENDVRMVAVETDAALRS